MRLRRNALLVRPIVEEKPSLVIVSKKFSHARVKCEIVHAGTGQFSDLGHFIPNDLMKGDIVLIRGGALDDIENIDGEDLYYVNEYDVLIVLSDWGS